MDMPRMPVQVTTEFPYHISARGVNRGPFPLPMEETWEIMQDYLYGLTHIHHARLHSFVLMQNHFHLLASFPDGNLSAAMQYFMGETSRQINFYSKRINQTYGGRFFRSILRSNHYYLLAYKYVYRNPVKARLCSRVEEYPFSTLHGLLGFRRMIVPVVEDTTLFLDVEGCLEWLNSAPKDQDLEAVRLALRKSEFSLPNKRSSRAPSALESQLL
ncbi:MAG: transposase [Bdellovibrionales bacterium]